MSIPSCRWRPLHPLQRRSWLFSYPAELVSHPMLLDDLIAIPSGDARDNHRPALVLAIRRCSGTIEGHRPRQGLELGLGQGVPEFLTVRRRAGPLHRIDDSL